MIDLGAPIDVFSRSIEKEGRKLLTEPSEEKKEYIYINKYI